MARGVLCFDGTRREEKKKREKHYLTGFLRCIYTEVFSSHLISSTRDHVSGIFIPYIRKEGKEKGQV